MAETATNAAAPEPIGQEAAFNKHRAAALALDKRDVKVRGDVLLARENFSTGLQAVRDHKEELALKWAPARIENLWGGIEYGDAALFATTRAEELDTTDGATRALISKAYVYREMLFAVVDMAVVWKKVPGERVAKIRQGSGPHDASQDVVSLVALVRDSRDALHGQTPITPEFLAEAERVGNDASRATKPGDARERRSPEADAAADLANRYWTLLLRAHEELRKAAYELWGDKLGEHVPPLQSRVVHASAPAATPTTPA